MVQSKKISAGLVLIAGLFGVSGTAFALPEVDVGSRPIVAPNVGAPVQTVDPDGATAVEEDDSVDAQSSAN